MKKLNKLVISPEKIMKNEELINLHGGYSTECTRECEDLYCDVTWNADDRCKVTCGSTDCSFIAAVKKD